MTAPCDARCPSGQYAGYVCCSPRADHPGPHCITSGRYSPPGYEVVHEWPREECKHADGQRIGEIGGRFGDEWCGQCGALRSWDNYAGGREAAAWVKPKGGGG